MLRLSHILTTAALVAVCAAPASAATFEQLHGSDQNDGASKAAGDTGWRSSYQPVPPSNTGQGQDLRSPDAADAAQHRGLYASDPDAYVLNRDYGSPDAARRRAAAGEPALVRAQPGLRLARRGRRRAGSASGADRRPRAAQRVLRRLRLGRRRHRRGRDAGPLQHRRRLGSAAHGPQAPPRHRVVTTLHEGRRRGAAPRLLSGRPDRWYGRLEPLRSNHEGSVYPRQHVRRLPDRRSGRPRRHGRRLPGDGPVARASRGAQADRAGARRGRALSQSLPARAAAGGLARPSERDPDLRGGRARRAALPGHALRGGQRPADVARRARGSFLRSGHSRSSRRWLAPSTRLTGERSSIAT